MVGVCPAETMPGNSLLVFSDRGETWQSVADDNILRLTLSPRSGMIVLNTVDNAEPVRAAFEKIRKDQDLTSLGDLLDEATKD